MSLSASPSSTHGFLLLIENSPALLSYWPDLRTSYLPRLVDQLRGSFPAHATNFYISETQGEALAKPYHSLDAGLKEVRFSPDPNNRLSTTQIRTAVEFLASQSTTQVRHLIVVASNPPTELSHAHYLHDPWHELAKSLTQDNIRLHLALTSNLRSGRLPSLFEQTLKWQRNTEEPLWLPTYSTSFIFRVSAQPRYSDSATDANDSTRSMDMYTTKSLDLSVSSTPPAEAEPTLVSQLQQVHGLTKKKVYGAKPTRVPFIKEDSDTRVRMRERYRQAPLKSSAECSGKTSPITGGNRDRPRSRSNTRVERARISRPYAPPRSSHWPLSSPDIGDSSSSSPYSSSSLSSPSSPVAQFPPAETYPLILSSSSGSSDDFAWDQMFVTSPSQSPGIQAHTPFYSPFASNTSFSSDREDMQLASFHASSSVANFDVTADTIPTSFPAPTDYVSRAHASGSSLHGPAALLHHSPGDTHTQPEIPTYDSHAFPHGLLRPRVAPPPVAEMLARPSPLAMLLPPPPDPILETHGQITSTFPSALHPGPGPDAHTPIPNVPIMSLTTIQQPIPIAPPICAPGILQEQHEESVNVNIDDVHGTLPTPPFQYITSNARNAHGGEDLGFVSSSSLTGWAG